MMLITAAASAEDPPTDSMTALLDAWGAQVAQARATQPDWSSPLVTTTAMLEQRLRFDASFQRAGNSTSTTSLDGGKGLDLIITDADEIQIAADPYTIRRPDNGRGDLDGFADWPVLRFKHRLASSPASGDNYVVSVWLQLQVPSGLTKLTNNAYTLLPTLGYGKGWGDFDIQGTIGAVIPTAYEGKLGSQVVNNVALQYHVLGLFWPQVEVNWTYYPDGQRGGKNQVFLTPGVVVGRVKLSQTLAATIGFGYQTAVAPKYRASPLTPAYDHAWIVTSRLSF